MVGLVVALVCVLWMTIPVIDDKNVQLSIRKKHGKKGKHGRKKHENVHSEEPPKVTLSLLTPELAVLLKAEFNASQTVAEVIRVLRQKQPAQFDHPSVKKVQLTLRSAAELDPKRTLAESGIVDGAEIIADTVVSVEVKLGAKDVEEQGMKEVSLTFTAKQQPKEEVGAARARPPEVGVARASRFGEAVACAGAAALLCAGLVACASAAYFGEWTAHLSTLDAVDAALDCGAAAASSALVGTAFRGDTGAAGGFSVGTRLLTLIDKLIDPVLGPLIGGIGCVVGLLWLSSGTRGGGLVSDPARSRRPTTRRPKTACRPSTCRRTAS